VRNKVYGIVAMVNVFLHGMYVMAHQNGVTQAGVLTVLMVQMKTSMTVVLQVHMRIHYVTLQNTVKMTQLVTQALKATVHLLTQDITVMVV